MEFMLFVGVFLLAITIGMCVRLDLVIKDDYNDVYKKEVRTNQLKTIACGVVGLVLTLLYVII